MRVFFLMLAWLCCANGLRACDVCMFYDYATTQNRNYMGLFHQHRVFNGYEHLGTKKHFLAPGKYAGRTNRLAHEPENSVLQVDKTYKDFEVYDAYELRANINIGGFLNATFRVPYEVNRVYYQRVTETVGTPVIRDTTLRSSGFGNVMGLLEYVWEVGNTGKTHIIKPGFGMRFGTAAANVFRQGSQIDHTIKPGAGDPDYFVRLSYRYLLLKSGLNFSYIKGWTRENDLDYQYGGSTNLILNYSMQWELGDVGLIPESGLYFESSKPDKEYGKTIPLTGGYVTMLNVGIGARWKAFTLNTLYQHPIMENLNGKQIGNAGRLLSGLVFNF